MTRKLRLMAMMTALVSTAVAVVPSSACRERAPSETGISATVAKQPGRDPFAALPERDRASVRELVERVVQLEKAGQWNAIFGILDNEAGESRAHFLAATAKSRRLEDFTVTRAFALPQTRSYIAVGCGAFPQPNGGTERFESTVHVRLTDDGWRTGPVAIVLDKDAPGGTRRCDAPSR